MTTATGHFDLTGRMIHDGDIVRVDNAAAGKIFGVDGVRSSAWTAYGSSISATETSFG